jgi:hypothetical protein
MPACRCRHVVLADGPDGTGGRVGVKDHGLAGADPAVWRLGHGHGGDARGEESVCRVPERGFAGGPPQPPALVPRHVHRLVLPEHARKKLALRGDKPPANLHTAERRLNLSRRSCTDH